MTGSFEQALVFLLLFAGCLSGFASLRGARGLRAFLERQAESLGEHGRKFRMQRRKALQDAAGSSSLLIRIDRDLEYSGLKKRFPHLVPELWIACKCALGLLFFLSLTPLYGFAAGLAGGVLGWWALQMVLIAGKAEANRIVESNLMKFLDFLGNYSVTGGELAGILGQISRYLDDPLRTALEECEAESRITGDVGMAVLLMTEKIEHPQFRLLARNLEITSRYSADFGPLVADSRRGLREYLRQSRERKSMLKEAAFNMVLLTVLSLLTLTLVGSLTETPVTALLGNTVAGHIALGIFGFVYLLFLRQVFAIAGE
ncbi:MAG: hypothetical protein IKS07_06560 [Lachnospiraceae bacterium]|nr:hypothetical protein [Lachnospiraceae bacterium]